MSVNAYHIGTPGLKWGSSEVDQWRSERVKSRSYLTDVVSALDPLRASFDVVQYGHLDYDSVDGGKIDHPLFAVKTRDWDAKKPSVLVTGGVHGYETSGVHGALRFLAGGEAAKYAAKGLNVVVAPCVSPWGYEHIQRWTSEAVDPNRSFASRTEPEKCGSQESAALVGLLNSCGVEKWACHVDLHETTDTDETEFRKSKAARDGLASEPGTIPDGFYLCGDGKNPVPDFQRAVIAGVRSVTHIAPADPDGTIIGSPVVDEGVILYDYTALGLCGGVTNARFTTTTEVYPDSPKATDEICNQGQVKAITSALDYLLADMAVDN